MICERQINSNWSYNVFTGVWCFLSAAVDIFITGTLCWALKDEVKGFNIRTDDVVRKCVFFGARLLRTTG